MKAVLVLKSLLFIFLLIFFTSLTYGVIQGSVHDFSGSGWSNGEICLPCHIPHNADLTISHAPLWNHQVTAASFTVYNSASMMTTPEQPRSLSRLCLSCHDGTIALDSFGGNVGSEMITGSANLSTDLSDDHPVSIWWEHQNEINGSICSNCHIVSPWGFNDILPFYDRYIECPTCHDVHNGTGIVKLLRKPLANSEICLHCHGK